MPRHKFHAFKVGASEGQAASALTDPILEAVLPLVRGDLTDFTLKGSSQQVQVWVFLAPQFVLEVGEEEKSQGDRSGE